MHKEILEVLGAINGGKKKRKKINNPYRFYNIISFRIFLLWTPSTVREIQTESHTIVEATRSTHQFRRKS